MPSWCEQQGRVSRAFDEWTLVSKDIRAFLDLGVAFAAAEYDRIWQECENEPAHEDSPELIDVFEARVNGLHKQDFEWMLCSGALRDAVTSFEVYLEKAREEVLRHHGQPIAVSENAPYWGPLKAFFAQLDIEIETGDVKRIRALRHLLSHRRGELRTEALREAFQTINEPGVFPPREVDLALADVSKALEELAEAVRTIDRVAYEHTWGGTRIRTLVP